MKREEFDEIVLKEKETRLSISRIPKKTKAAFVAFAEEEFEGDYGMCLKTIFDNYSLWKLLFENVDMKLDLILNNLNGTPKEGTEEIRLLSGKIIKKEVGNSNGNTK